MDVVLREDVEKLGLRGDVVSVARGYARNYLLPRGLAERATPGLLRELERREALRARHEAQTVDEARAIAARLEAIELRFDVNAGPSGSLFGSVTATNVVDRLWEQEKIRVERRKLALEPIKRVGRYAVPVEVFADVTAALRLVVAPEGQEPPSAEELEATAEAPGEAAAAAPEPGAPSAPADEAGGEPAADEPSVEAAGAGGEDAQAPREITES